MTFTANSHVPGALRAVSFSPPWPSLKKLNSTIGSDEETRSYEL